MKKEKLFGVALLVFAVVKLTEQPRYVMPPPRPDGNLQNNYAAWLAYAQNVYKQAVALYGSIQNAINVLWGPGGPFEKTPVPEYDAGTLFWGEVEGGGVAGIGKVYATTPPGKNECVDGKFSDSRGRGMCSYHGGSIMKVRKTPTKEPPPPPPETFEQFVNRRAHEMATESKQEMAKAIKKNHSGYTSTWYKAELRRQYNFDYAHYKMDSGYRKMFKKEYEDIYGVSIGAIYPAIPAVYECNDGTFTTSDSPRGCGRHGGKKSGTPVQFTTGGGSGLLNIVDVPLSKILIDTRLFQGREKAFSERSVNNIIQAVQNGTFIWENLDPITLWMSPESRLYLLSGHSREEAFKRLAAAGITYQGKGFERIPSKIMKNVPLEVAQTVALESNTLSTKETDIERAAYYRKLRQAGQPEKNTLATIKRNEGRNWPNIYAYTFLSPSGATWATLRQFGESEDTSATLAKSLAKWIGQVRRAIPQLTNEHENELYRWLFEQKGYGTGRGQVSSEREFQEKVGEFVQKNTFFGVFDAEKPLNIQNLLTKSPVEQEYDLQIENAQREVQQAESDLKNKIRLLAQNNASKADVQRITAPLEARARNARLDLQRLLTARAQVIEYSKNEPALFGRRRRGSVRGISPSWAFLLPGV